MSISRRAFLGSLASSSLALLGEELRPERRIRSAQRAFAFVASDTASEQGIHVFRVAGEEWRRVQFERSAAPASLALSPDGRTLFVANRIANYLGLPTGSVESYSIDPHGGRLRLLSRRALTLSATEPEHLAISHDGRRVLVAATGGGAYNSFAVDEAGSLMPVACVRKELGSGSHPVLQACAHPAHVLFDSRGRMLVADLGADRVSVLHQRDGLLMPKSRLQTGPGVGPRRLALHRAESLLVIAGGLKRSVAVHRYDLTHGVVEPDPIWVQSDESSAGGWTSLVAHPTRDLVLGSWSDGARSGVVCWQVVAKTGALRQRDELSMRADLRTMVTLDASDHTFVVADAVGGRVRSLRCEPNSGELAWGRDLAVVPGACAIAVRTA